MDKDKFIILHSSWASKDLTCWLSNVKIACCGQKEDVTQSNPFCDPRMCQGSSISAAVVAWLGWESIFPKNLWYAGKICVQKDKVSQCSKCSMPSYIIFLNTKDVGKGELIILTFFGCCDLKKVALLYMCTQPPSISKHRSVVVTNLLGGLHS